MLDNPNIKTFLISKAVLVLLLIFGTKFLSGFLAGLVNWGTSAFVGYIWTFISMFLILVVGEFIANKIWGTK